MPSTSLFNDGEIEFTPDDLKPPAEPSNTLPPPDRLEYEGKLKRIEIETIEGTLLDKEMLGKAAFDIGRQLRENLAGLPAKLSAKVSAEMNRRKNERTIRNECARICREIHRRMADAGGR